MREILFRGRSMVQGSEWLYGDVLIYENSAQIWETINNRKHNSVVSLETVGQYTGMTDKNGTKIFEGDIVLFEDESPSNYEYHDCTEMRCGAIEYGDNCFYITDRISVEMEDLIYDGKLEVEVIGNIHDNPELLKGGE
jgi:uncharacterized phage protein (TIGR01671 family)